MTDLYENLKSFSDFEDFTNPQHYVPVPDSWSVLVAHIVGAADAARAGRYRDVSTVGAAAITAVKNAIKDLSQDFPYVVGGDTATIVLPESCRLAAVDALLALQRMVRRKFKLEMIVQSMFVLDIYRGSGGRTVEVARYEVHAGKCVAIFRGGGLAYAEGRIKNNQEGSMDEKKDASKAETVVSLDGLSCRWNKLPAKHGCILSLVVCDNPDVEGDVYQDVLQQIDTILNHDPKKGNPVHIELGRYKGVAQILREEQRFHPSVCSAAFLGRAVEIIICVLIFKFGLLTTLFFDAPSYADSMQAHTDFRKFDGMLRMVLDCTKDQANAIEFMLQDLHRHGGRLYYGLFKSSHSVMTCLVENPTDGDHIHFMDGDNGGYVMAGKRLQDQIDAQDCVLPNKAKELSVHHLIPDTSLNGDTTSASWNDESSLGGVDLELGSVMSDGSVFAASQWSVPPLLASLSPSSSSLDCSPSVISPIRQLSSPRRITTTPVPTLPSPFTRATPTARPTMLPPSSSSPLTSSLLLKRPHDNYKDEDNNLAPLYNRTDTMPLKIRRISPSPTLETASESSSTLDHQDGRGSSSTCDEEVTTKQQHQPDGDVLGDERLSGKPTDDDDDPGMDSYSTIDFDESAVLGTTGKKKKSKKKKKKKSKKKKEAVKQDRDAALEVATLLLQQCLEAPPKQDNNVALEVATTLIFKQC